MGCRKNLKRLTPTERNNFVQAFLTLFNSGALDKYAEIHSGADIHGHGGPAFVAWHREFVRRLELELQSVDPSVDLPYWDWTDDNVNTAGTESYIWRDDFLGGPGDDSGGGFPTGPAGGYPITSGPFAGLFTRRPFDIFTGPGTGGTIANRMANPDFSVFRGIEGPHGSAHVFCGGHVMPFDYTPKTPDFWMIHCNVDRLWAEWIDRHQASPGFEPYKPATGGPTGHNLNDTMWPWNGTSVPFAMSPWEVTPEMVTPADMIDHVALGYQYDTLDPTCNPVLKNVLKDFRDGPGGGKPIKEFMPKEFKERGPKELKELGPKELKERGPKELKERGPKELKELGPKELKELGPKELKEGGPKESKDIRETGPFIRPDLRPDLRGAALGFDVDPGELEALRRRLNR